MNRTSIEERKRTFGLLGFTYIFLMCQFGVSAQCSNSIQFPTSPIIASQFNDTLIITEMQEAGQYYSIRGLALNRTYQFGSSDPGDFVTIRDRDGLTPLAFGVTPVSHTITADDVVTVHINLSAGCGSEALFRTTTATCLDCPGVPGRFGIAETDPVATLDVQGGVRVGNATRPAEAGMIRWNEDAADFEGYDGTKWRSFTKAQGGWGIDFSPVAFETAKLVEDSAGLYYGNSLAISDDYVFVGRPFLDTGGPGGTGAVLIYQNFGGSWTLTDTLVLSLPQTSYSGYGSNIEISEDRVIISSGLEDVDGTPNQGAAYIYRRSGNTWIEEARLTAFDGDTSDLFGSGVSISGEYAVVGAIGDDYPGVVSQGSSYIFKRTGTQWAFDQKITSSQPTEAAYYGEDVAIFGDYLIVGARREDAGGATMNGTAYIYEKDIMGNWNEVERLVPSVLEPFGQKFGLNVDLFDSVAVVTNSALTVNDTINAGGVFVFERIGGSWHETAILSLSDPEPYDFLGGDVAILGSTIVTGAQGRDINANEDQGACFIFQKNDDGIWSLQKTLVASDGIVDELFGREVGLASTVLAVGSSFHNIGEVIDQGAIWIYQIE